MKIRTEVICTYFIRCFFVSFSWYRLLKSFPLFIGGEGFFCFYAPWKFNDRLKVIRLCDDTSKATLRWDSGAGTISYETARNLQKIIDKRTNVLYNSKLVKNVFTLQLNTSRNTYFLLIGFMPTHIIWPKKYGPILGQ